MLPALFVIPCALLILAITISTLKRGPFGRMEVDAAGTTSVDMASRALTQRNWLLVGIGVMVFVVMTAIGVAVAPADSGRTQTLAPLTAAIAAVIVIAVRPLSSIRESEGTRSADLVQRRLGHFAPGWMIGAAAAVHALAIMIYLGFGLMADSDGMTLSRSTSLDVGYGPGYAARTGTPFPGFFYGIPLIVAVVLMAVVAGIALTRITNASRPTSVELSTRDSATRRLAIHLVVRISAGAVALTTGMSLVNAGSTSTSVGEGLIDYISADASLLAVGTVATVAGWIFQLLGFALVVWATRSALTTPVRAKEPVSPR